MCKEIIFPGRYAPLTYYEDVLVIRKWRVTPGKYAISLHTCISITDKAINENKSIAVGPFYMGNFEPIWTLLPEDVAVLNPMG